jgi:hypothetical protein
MSKYKFSGIASTTHKDRHGDRVSKEFLEDQVKTFKEHQQPVWGYCKHLTSLPPSNIVTDQAVELRNDGEYQLVVHGEMYDLEDFENLLQTDIIVPEVTGKDVTEIIQRLKTSDVGELQIQYDPKNFNPSEVEPIIESINELIPTKSVFFIRKAEIPPPVIFVLLAYATGFIARLGEVTADKVLKQASSVSSEFKKRFAQLITKSNNPQKPDVIFGIPIYKPDVIIEGAVEEADIVVLNKAWEKLPNLYCLAERIIKGNRRDYFSQLKFLFNPVTENWEVNYILTRNSNRVILGPRYSDSSHPLHKRWNMERHNFIVDN